MSPLFLYLIKSTLWLIAFFLVYKILLQKETFHTFNRFFLLAGMVAALCMPFAVLYHTVSMEIVTDTSVSSQLPTVNLQSPPIAWTIIVQNIAIALYIIGIALLFTKTFRSIRPLLEEIKHHSSNDNLIFTQNYKSPFSFGKYIFIPKGPLSDIDMQLILQHESVHTREMHYFDLWLAKIICILQFFNPLAWLYAKAIQENCEYIADQRTVQHTGMKEAYMHLLIRNSIPQQFNNIALHFAYPLILKRLNNMKQLQSNKLASLKSLAVLPLACLIMVGYAQTKVVETPAANLIAQEKAVTQPAPVQNIQEQPVSAQATTEVVQKSEPKKQATEQTQPDTQDEVVVVGYGASNATPDDKNNEVFIVADEMPSLVEGSVAEYLARNIKYPVDAQRRGIQGRVICQFIVEKDGSVSNVTVVRSVDPVLDAEACRVIYTMPKWNPGKQKGEAVRVKYTLPVNFKLQK